MEGDKRTSCQVALVGWYTSIQLLGFCIGLRCYTSIIWQSKVSSKHFHIVAGSSTRCLSVTSDQRAPTVTNHCVFELPELDTVLDNVLDTAAAASESVSCGIRTTCLN